FFESCIFRHLHCTIHVSQRRIMMRYRTGYGDGALGAFIGCVVHIFFTVGCASDEKVCPAFWHTLLLFGAISGGAAVGQCILFALACLFAKEDGVSPEVKRSLHDLAERLRNVEKDQKSILENQKRILEISYQYQCPFLITL
ncbi:hypothetical protein PENTCL1PPCAC_27786, partial [Pristionchus entomophagus]